MTVLGLLHGTFRNRTLTHPFATRNTLQLTFHSLFRSFQPLTQTDSFHDQNTLLIIVFLSPPLNLIHSFIILNLLRAYIAVSCLHVSFFSFLFGSLACFLIVTPDLHVHRTRGGCPALACRLRFIPRIDMKSALHLRGLRSPPLVPATPSRLLETRIESTPPLCSFSCS